MALGAVTLLLAGLFFAIGSLASLSQRSNWWIRMWDFPRLHLAILLGVIALTYVLTSFTGGWAEWMWLAVVLGTAAWQFSHVLPFTLLWPREVKNASQGASATLSILTSNVQMENEDFERWLRVVSDADPDLIVALETDSRWAKEIERLYPSYPHRVEQVQDNYYGMLLLSRPRLIQPEVRFLVQEDVPSIHTQVEVGGVQTVEIHALHPRPPEPVREQDAAPRDAELVIAARMVGGSNRPAIVIGDLNDVAWSYTTRLFRKLSHLLDPRRGRGLYNTFHARYPLIRLPLDHVFHSEHFRLVDLRVLDNVGSDHFPVFAEFSIESDAAEMQEAPDAEASERREAEQRKQRAESREN